MRQKINSATAAVAQSIVAIIQGRSPPSHVKADRAVFFGTAPRLIATDVHSLRYLTTLSKLPLAINSSVPTLRVQIIHHGLRGCRRANLLQGTERERAHVAAGIVERPEELGF